MELILNKKYLCKKSLQTDITDIQLDKYYEIVKIGTNHIMILSDKEYEAFSKLENNSVSPYYFYDYFYTK